MKREYCEYGVCEGQKHIADVSISYTVDEDGSVVDVIAEQDIDLTVYGKRYIFEKGDTINCEGDESLIGSEDIILD